MKDNQTTTVWDPFVRLFHWSLVLSFAVAWLGADSWRDLHEWAGYCAALLISIRVLWGFVGSRYARFSQFVKKPTTALEFVKAMLRREEPRYIGHNPAGGIMILGLLSTLFITALTGWMYTLDAFWGEEWVENAHEAGANLMLLLVVVHVAGVLYTGRQHKENLVKSMITGQKRRAQAGDIE